MKSNAPLRKSGKKPHHRTTMGIAQRARTMAKIVDASIKVFADKGPYSPVIEDFVKAAGIARGTFYYYFSTVEEVRKLAIEEVAHRHAAEVVPVIMLLTHPIFRFSTALRLYQRRTLLDPMFGDLMSSSIYKATIIEKTVRVDLHRAIDQNLVRIRSVDAAYTIFAALNDYAARFPPKLRPVHLSGTEVARSILFAWGTDTALIEKALSIPLPPVETLHLF